MSSAGHCLGGRRSHQDSDILPIKPNHVLEGLWVTEKVIVTGKLQGWAIDTSGKQPHRGRVETCEVGTQHKRQLWLNVL